MSRPSTRSRLASMGFREEFDEKSGPLVENMLGHIVDLGSLLRREKELSEEWDRAARRCLDGIIGVEINIDNMNPKQRLASFESAVGEVGKRMGELERGWREAEERAREQGEKRAMAEKALGETQSALANKAMALAVLSKTHSGCPSGAEYTEAVREVERLRASVEREGKEKEEMRREMEKMKRLGEEEREELGLLRRLDTEQREEVRGLKERVEVSEGECRELRREVERLRGEVDETVLRRQLDWLVGEKMAQMEGEVEQVGRERKEEEVMRRRAEEALEREKRESTRLSVDMQREMGRLQKELNAARVHRDGLVEEIEVVYGKFRELWEGVRRAEDGLSKWESTEGRKECVEVVVKRVHEVSCQNKILLEEVSRIGRENNELKSANEILLNDLKAIIDMYNQERRNNEKLPQTLLEPLEPNARGIRYDQRPLGANLSEIQMSKGIKHEPCPVLPDLLLYKEELQKAIQYKTQTENLQQELANCYNQLQEVTNSENFLRKDYKALRESLTTPEDPTSKLVSKSNKKQSSKEQISKRLEEMQQSLYSIKTSLHN